MTKTIFDFLPLWFFYFSIPLILLLAFEAGYKISKNIPSSTGKDTFDSVSPMVSGLLAMLAFVLALTFSMAFTQHNLRMKNVLHDAEVIGTAYLRADSLNEQDKIKVKQLLKKYVDTLVHAVEEASTKEMKAMLEKSQEIHHLLWSLSISAMNREPTLQKGLLLQSINEVIDSQQKRISSGLYNRIPNSVWLILLAISILTMMTMGSQAKLIQSRRMTAIIPLILAFTALTTTIMDLDRPKEGMIIIGQEAMLDLQKSLEMKPQ